MTVETLPTSTPTVETMMAAQELAERSKALAAYRAAVAHAAEGETPTDKRVAEIRSAMKILSVGRDEFDADVKVWKAIEGDAAFLAGFDAEIAKLNATATQAAADLRAAKAALVAAEIAQRHTMNLVGNLNEQRRQAANLRANNPRLTAEFSKAVTNLPASEERDKITLPVIRTNGNQNNPREGWGVGKRGQSQPVLTSLGFNGNPNNRADGR